MGFTRITEEDIKNKGVSGLPDTPNLPVADMQAKFDELSKDVIVPKVNALVDELESENASANIGIIPPDGFAGKSVQELCDEFASVFGANESSHVHTNMPILDGFDDTDHLKHNGTNVMLESDMSDYVTSDELSTEQMNQYRNIMGQVAELYDNVNDRLDETNITIVDNLTETVKGKALDATQGAILDGKITAANAIATEAHDNAGRALSGISVIQDTYAKKTELPEIATSENPGKVKPDGTTITIDEDGTIHAIGGGGGGTGGTSNYNDLSNKPSINGVTLSGNKTLKELGIDAIGIGADPFGSANTALTEAKAYADIKVDEVEGLVHETVYSYDAVMSTSEDDFRKNAGAYAVKEGFEKLGGFTPVIDSTGKITGYKTKAGADTVFPFSSGGKFATLNVIMSANATEARPFSYNITNDENEEYYGSFVTGATSNNAQLSFNKSGKFKLIFRSAYRGLNSSITLKHGNTTITTDSGNTAMTEFEIDAVVGDTLKITITNKTNSYGFQAGEVTVYPA